LLLAFTVPELQGEPEEISKEKARLAAVEVQHVLSLCVQFIFLLCVYKYIMFVFLLEIEGERACFGGGYLSLLQCLKGSSRY